MTRRIIGITNDTFRSMGSRNFRVFFGGQSISQIGNWMTLVAQTLLVFAITNSGVAVGVLAAFQFGPILLFGAWAGLIADRTDKRRLLVIVQSIAMGQSLVLAGLAFMPNPPLLAIYAAACVGGITMAFENPTRRSLIIEMVPPSDIQNAVSLNSALMTGARVIGPAIAGVLIATVGFGWVFLVDGFSYVAVLGSLLMLRTRDLRRGPLAPKGKGQVRDGLRYVRSVRDLWIPLAMTALVGTLAMNLQVVLPLFIDRTLDESPTTFTLLFTFVSVGSFIGALLTARRRFVDVHHVVVASAMFGVTLLALAFAPTLMWALIVGIAVGGASVVFITSSTAMLQIHSDPIMRGRVLALQAIVFFGSTPIGGPILGWISDATSPRVGIAIGGVAALGAAAWGSVESRRGADGHVVASNVPIDDSDLQPA
jgi:MFS family permease